jgi:hypothetical protein
MSKSDVYLHSILEHRPAAIKSWIEFALWKSAQWSPLSKHEDLLTLCMHRNFFLKQKPVADKVENRVRPIQLYTYMYNICMKTLNAFVSVHAWI